MRNELADDRGLDHGWQDHLRYRHPRARKALAATSEKRGTQAAMDRYREVMAEVVSDAGMLARWAAYVRRYPYVGDMTLEEACGTVVAIMETIDW